MRWVRDTTGRFLQRPHYDQKELDQECESIVTGFLRSRSESISFPIETNDLTVLLEKEVDDLDLYADLQEEGQDVEGVTDFFPGKKPRVRISRELSEQDWRENRLRTTLAHELGHVKFHNFLWGLDPTLAMSTFGFQPTPHAQRCKREAILGARSYDWMEWQAGYASGAFLMPATELLRIVHDAIEEMGLFTPISLSSTSSDELILKVLKAFQVSTDASRVRLLQTGYLTEKLMPPSLFS